MLTDTWEPMMTDKDRPDLSAADQAWLDRLTHDLVRRDELSTAAAVRLSEQQREALLALRAEERAEGAEPTDVTELFGSPTDVAAQLAGETDDKEARAAQERQEAGVVAQVCSAMLLAGAYFVLIWPFKILLSSKEIHFGLEHALAFAGLIAMMGGVGSAVRTALRGLRALALQRASVAVLGLAVFVCAVTSSGWWRGSGWLGVLYGAVLVAVGWRYVDWDREDHSRHARHGSSEQWYAELDRRLAVSQMVGRPVRDRLVDETRALVGTADPWEEIGDPGWWARRLVHEGEEAHVSHARGSGRLLLILGLLAGLAALVSWLWSSWSVATAWTLLALQLCVIGLTRLRGAGRRRMS